MVRRGVLLVGVLGVAACGAEMKAGSAFNAPASPAPTVAAAPSEAQPATPAAPATPATAATPATPATPSTPSTPAANGSTFPASTSDGNDAFTASGTFRGQPLSLACRRFGTHVEDHDVAVQGASGMVLLSCHDAQSGVQVNVTIAEPQVMDIVPRHSSEGSRIAVSGPEGDFVSTSDSANNGKISVKTWDTGTRRISGSFTMQWPKDGAGVPGTVNGTFDVVGLPEER